MATYTTPPTSPTPTLATQPPIPAHPIEPAITWLANNPLIAVAALIAILIGINYGWKRLTNSRRDNGYPLAPLGMAVRRAYTITVKQDTYPVLNKPAKLAARLTWLTWTRYTKLALLATLIWLIVPPTNFVHFPGQDDTRIWLYGLAPLLVAWLILAKHLKTVIAIRHRIIMQMFEVAAAECRYQSGAELNPWGYIQIQTWDDLYTPGVTVVMYPPKYRSEDLKNREAFERNFNGTVSDQHSWTYKWESANNRVIASPVPYIPEQAPYPFPDNKPWNIFPLGEAAGGKEAYVDVTTFPHMLIAGTTGSGKATSLDTPIPVPPSERFPDGWATMGDVAVGDTVFDENGEPTRIVGMSDIDENPDLYDVEFSDGTVVTANAEHLWFTEDLSARRARRSSFEPKRRRLISTDAEKRLRDALDASKPDDEMTAEQLADLAGTTRKRDWIRETCVEVGPVGETQIEFVRHTPAHIQVGTQKVAYVPAVKALPLLASYEPQGAWKKRNAAVWETRRAAFAGLAATVTSDSVPVATLARCGDMSPSAVRNILRDANIATSTVVEKVERYVPAVTRTMVGTPARTYNSRALISALLRRVERPANDMSHRSAKPGVRTTLEILATLRDARGAANHFVPVAKPLVLPEADLAIDPYLLGCWAGDGRANSGQICGIDHEIAARWEAAGYRVAVQPATANGSSTNPDFRVWRIEGLTTALRKLGILDGYPGYPGYKSIPATYLRGSIAQRKELLAGLLDTDGDVSPNGQARFRNTSKALCEAVVELARTLGLQPTMTEERARLYGVDKGPVWSVVFRAPESPFHLTRKTETFNRRNTYSVERNGYRRIVGVRSVASRPARCIMVDSPTRLFLVGSAMTPTHNSVTQRTILLHCLQHPDWRVLLIDPKGWNSRFTGRPATF